MTALLQCESEAKAQLAGRLELPGHAPLATRSRAAHEHEESCSSRRLRCDGAQAPNGIRGGCLGGDKVDLLPRGRVDTEETRSKRGRCSGTETLRHARVIQLGNLNDWAPQPPD